MSEITKHSEGWRCSRSGNWYHPLVGRGCIAHRGAVCEECGALFFERLYKAKGKKGGSGRHFCSTSCSSSATIRDQDLSHLAQYRIAKGTAPHNFKGRTRHSAGYWVLSEIGGGGERRLEHRVVMAEVLGRPLREDEIVHHIDGDKTNNRIENLQIMTQEEHLKMHQEEDKVKDPSAYKEKKARASDTRWKREKGGK